MVNYAIIITTIFTLLLFIIYGVISILIPYYRRLYFIGANSLFFNSFEEYSKPRSSRIPPLRTPLKIGDILIRDFRQKKKSITTDALRIVSFNIEKGRQINKIIKLFKSLNADIYCLQEVDINTHRTNYVDIIGEIANELHLNSMFACEQIIYDMNVEQGDIKQDGKNEGGYEGTAILTKFDFLENKGIILKCVRKKYIHKHGRHNQCSALINIQTSFFTGIVSCYSLHFDPHYCGINGRIDQYMQVMKSVEQQRMQMYQHRNDKSLDEKNVKLPKIYQIICGDFNTVCSGIARLNVRLSTDFMSVFGSFMLGLNEAQYFNKYAVEFANGSFNCDFEDPFEKSGKKDYTFHSFGGLYKSKLDWCLLGKSSFKVVGKRVGGVDDRCSDHQWIMVDVLPI